MTTHLIQLAIMNTESSFDLRHHGDAETASGLVDLAVNVRTTEMPTWLRERLSSSMLSLSAYPEQSRARTAVAARHGRSEEEVLLTNGAAEAFVLIARSLDPERPHGRTVVIHPQFTEPEAALRAAGHSVERVILNEADGFRLDTDLVPSDADLVIIGNPTNPTSILHPADAVASLARPGRLLVVDEAFADCIPGESESLATRSDLPGVVVVRSLTKMWGLAGLRVGYLLAQPHIVERLASLQPLWPVSTPALAALEICSSPAAVAEGDGWASELTELRSYLIDGLLQLGFDVPGDQRASFVLVRIDNAAALREQLRRRGWAVRRGDTFPGLGPDWLRIAVR
ncbi:MAG: Rv2231c family pyridoxal phosphate-dependent protein CobC, partial [Actinomycetota bacterium]